MFVKDTFKKIVSQEKAIAVIGLGYVGLPLAIAFSKKLNVIGFDINENKINKYRSGEDVTGEIGNDVIRDCKVFFTCDEQELNNAQIIIIAVPTPISTDKTPNLSPVEDASKIVARNLSKGSIVVYESTVYPGVTEEICMKILEDESGLKSGIDFKVGYSPERINPGDKIHRLENIVKIVSGMDEETLDIIAKLYELVVEVGVYRAENIKVAEAAKVVENSQRDINIAFMNELSMVFHKMGIDTKSVINAMATKWNAMTFYPGLVGGHCIGVDPYYFIYKAEQLGYHSQIILSGRKVNDEIPFFVAENIIKCLAKSGKLIKGARLAFWGLTFKENCPDIRNSKVIDIIEYLKEYDIESIVVDPMAARDEVYREYGIILSHIEEVNNVDGVVVAVSHNQFKNISLEQIKNMHKPGVPVLIDIKGVFDFLKSDSSDFIYWSL